MIRIGHLVTLTMITLYVCIATAQNALHNTNHHNSVSCYLTKFVSFQKPTLNGMIDFWNKKVVSVFNAVSTAHTIGLEHGSVWL